MNTRFLINSAIFLAALVTGIVILVKNIDGPPENKTLPVPSTTKTTIIPSQIPSSSSVVNSNFDTPLPTLTPMPKPFVNVSHEDDD